MASDKHLFTSESVTEGHPDKVADQISDAILDGLIAKDKNCRVACETLVTTGLAFVAGEITTNAYVDIPRIIRQVIQDVGYNDSSFGFDSQTCAVITSIDEQSPDIAQGVTEGLGLDTDQGAGDQGIMFGYASNETPELMPMPIQIAHRLVKRLADVRKNNILDFVRPDGKAQVTIEYNNGLPVRIDTIVLSTQHSADVAYEDLKGSIIEEVIRPVIPDTFWKPDEIEFHINPTGSFILGGPKADCGVTGRKIIVDTYGGVGSHGGGAFSGKDPSKVDRSASYAARYLAKNIVASGLAAKCEIQLGYAIGRAQPVSIMVNTFDTGKFPDEKFSSILKSGQLFDLRPKAIIKNLELLNPIYRKTAVYGHFGREEPEFTWERTDLVERLKELI